LQNFPQRFEAALKASGRSRDEIAEEAGTTVQTLSRIVNGHQIPQTVLLFRIARAARTTVGSLLGDPDALSNDDYVELQRFRDWIEDKLPKIDARSEPNAVLTSGASAHQNLSRIADRRPDADRELRARGDSMSGAGILDNDTLQWTPSNDADACVGKIILCRLSGNLFVKRLVREHDRPFLISANPRYLPIAIESTDPLEILGVVTHRAGAVI